MILVLSDFKDVGRRADPLMRQTEQAVFYVMAGFAMTQQVSGWPFTSEAHVRYVFSCVL